MLQVAGRGVSPISAIASVLNIKQGKEELLGYVRITRMRIRVSELLRSWICFTRKAVTELRTRACPFPYL